MVILISLTFLNIVVPPLNPLACQQVQTIFFSSTFPLVLLTVGIQEWEELERPLT